MKAIDELKAEIKKAEKELESKKKELERIERALNFKKGDYVECQINGKRQIALLKLIRFAPDGRLAEIEVNTFGSGVFDVSNFKKWHPLEGDVCIFWDKLKEWTHIGIFKQYLNRDHLPYESHYSTYNNCIPFISEQQFKEHIGYEKEPTKEQSPVINTNIREVEDLLNDYLKYTCKVPLFPTESKISFLPNHFAYLNNMGGLVLGKCESYRAAIRPFEMREKEEKN